MKILEIGGKNYTFKFSVDASLYSECTEKVANLFVGLGEVGNVSKLIKNMSNIPQQTLIMFYAGLLECHNDEIRSEKDAKDLLKQYLIEHKDEDSATFYDVMNEMLECMADDGFFKLIGLEKLFNPTKQSKKPQYNKKKSTQITED